MMVTPILTYDDIISTHTPLAGRDRLECESIEQHKEISTHTPLAGRDNSGLRML